MLDGKKHHLKLLSFLFMTILICLIFLKYNNKQVLAADPTTAPAGVDVSKYFEHGTPNPQGSKNVFSTNSAKLYNNSQSVISLASGPSTYGATWSNADNKNYIDLDDTTSTQKISAWLYFGNGSGADPSLNGDGMALVFQNDDNGINALGAGGEGLGVYGYDVGVGKDMFLTTSYTYLSTNILDRLNYIVNSSIKNSMALEFDPQLNSNTKDSPTQNSTDNFGANHYYSLNNFDTYNRDVSFLPSDYPDKDNAVQGGSSQYGHIAVTYPGLSDSYHNINITDNSSKTNFTSAFSLIHTHLTSAAALVDDNDNQKRTVVWHHVTLNWTGHTNGTATVSYSFNDINPNDMTTNYKKSGSNFIRVDDSTTVNYQKVFGKTTGHILWGFTGSNTSNANVEDKLVDFESIPAMLNMNATSSITDNSLPKKTITADSDDNQMTTANGDSLTLNYDLDYVSGRQNWSNIVAKINLPDYFDLMPDDDVIGTINYKDSSGKIISSENLTSSDLDSTGKIINHKLSTANQIGTQDGNKITSVSVAVNGKSDNTTDTTVTSNPVSATFTGDNNISNLSTPTFKVKPKQTYTLALDTTNKINLPYKGTTGLVLPVGLHYTGNNFTDDDPIYYEITVNGKTYDATNNINSTTADATDNNIDLRTIIDNNTDFWNIFTDDDTVKKVYITARDANGVTSNKAEYDVTVIPNTLLQLSTTDLKFQDTQAISEKKILNRIGTFSLSVKSSNTPWYLYGSSTDLEDSDKDVFNGNLIYKKDSTSVGTSLQNNLTFIAKQTDSSDSDTDIPTTYKWLDNTGILLNDNGSNEQGTYTGKITWTLTDTPQA